MKKEEFYDRFLKVIRPEHNVFKPLTKELMIENGLLDEFTECVEKGIFSLIREKEQYFINWDLFKSYIKDQSSNTANNENKELVQPVQQLDNDTARKLISEMKKEIDELKEQVKEIPILKEQVNKLQEELNTQQI